MDRLKPYLHSILDSRQMPQGFYIVLTLVSFLYRLKRLLGDYYRFLAMRLIAVRVSDHAILHSMHTFA